MPRVVSLALLLFALLAQPASAQGKDQFVQAVIGYLTAIENPGATPESISHAAGAMREGLAAWDASIAMMEAGLRRQIGSAQPAQAARMRTELGAAYFERQRIADAVEQFNQARALDASFAPAHLFAGLALRVAGKGPEAGAAFSRTLALVPQDPATAYLASRHADADAVRANGRATLEQVIAKSAGVAPSVPFMSLSLLAGTREPAFLPVPYATVAALLASGQFDAFVKAASDLRSPAGASPEQVALAGAKAHLAAGRLQEAAAALQPLASAPSPSALAAWQLSRIYVLLQREADARAALESAARVRAVASEDRFFVALGRLRENQFAFDAAIDAFQRAVDVNPNDASAHRELGEAYAAQDRLDDALSEFLVAVILDPLEASAHVGRAQVYAARGRLPDAIAAFRSALAVASEHLEARYGLARALTQAGQVDEGRRELEAYQRLQTAAIERERRRHDASLEP
jgi:tetratricopeptide (TPR) repeat protein